MSETEKHASSIDQAINLIKDNWKYFNDLLWSGVTKKEIAADYKVDQDAFYRGWRIVAEELNSENTKAEKPRKARRKSRSLRQIVQLAVENWDEITKTSVSEVAKRINVHPGSMYRALPEASKIVMKRQLSGHEEAAVLQGDLPGLSPASNGADTGSSPQAVPPAPACTGIVRPGVDEAPAQTDGLPRLLGENDLARLLGLSPQDISRAISDQPDALPPVRHILGRRYFLENEVKDWLNHSLFAPSARLDAPGQDCRLN